MAMNLLPLGSLGAVESNGAVTFGIWLPWVSDSDGNSVYVKIIHERDQFLQNIPPQEFPLTHSVRDPYGDFWSSTVPIAGIAPPTQDSAWGTAGRYLYRGYITLGETLWKFIREATHRDRSRGYFRLDRPIVPIL
jgi:maltooligosyltrehalose trehalohydrolase